MKIEQLAYIHSPFLLLAPTLSFFLCLIFFLLLGNHFLLQPGIKVTVPNSEFLLEPYHDPLIVSITGEPLPELYFGNNRVSTEELSSLLNHKFNCRRLIIKADNTTPYRYIIEVINLALGCGLSVVLATDNQHYVGDNFFK